MNTQTETNNLDLLGATDDFARRHIGPRPSDVTQMLQVIGVQSLDQLIEQTVPERIRLRRPLNLPAARGEAAVLDDLRTLAKENLLYRNFIGMGYYPTQTPGVILRNILENPGWYTQYTPYQAEIAQGRLEALLNFQTMVIDLTGLEIANASLLDEATAAAEAMTLCKRAQKSSSTAQRFFVSETCHPQTIDLVQTRAEPLGIEVVVGNHAQFQFDSSTFGALIQYPDTTGDIHDYAAFCQAAHKVGALVVCACDLLALTLLRAPGEFGADVAVGNSQRFGVPMGYGGPHAAFMATKDSYKRIMPGRLVGVSKDVHGNPAMRLSLQTREQHIRRDKATSNICTAQVLLAVMASMYAVYHGPQGLKRIAQRVQLLTSVLAEALRQAGYTVNQEPVFDTLKISNGPRSAAQVIQAAQSYTINLRSYEDDTLGLSLDESTTLQEVETLLSIFGIEGKEIITQIAQRIDLAYPAPHARTSPYLSHPVFNSYHSESEMLRYINRLQSRDISLVHSMIPLGSCTMKLNATSEMIPVTWPEFAQMHPFAPVSQTKGYRTLFQRLEAWLAEITGFSATSLQPNAGSQGEYAGLLSIRSYHLARGEGHRRICLIPSSAHGTNPASAVMAGMEVVVVDCDTQGNIDVADLQTKAEQHSQNLAALMVTYPSTHGVFEEAIVDICALIHQHGGQVYMDGANMNAQVGLCRPGDIGADVCHLNLHKTFCIPHGGGGPGMGPICVAAHLAPYLPNYLYQHVGAAVREPRRTISIPHIGDESKTRLSVSAAPYGSAAILPIPYAYIAMMGVEGLRRATEIAILNANYMAARLSPHYPVLYTGANGRVAHECIIDLRPLKPFVEVEDVAKRLMDYGFHAPTMSFPVAGTLMIEPTESESKEELDRFCEAMILIREEIGEIERGEMDAEDNPLKHAPHTAASVIADAWPHRYGRERAAYPAPWVKAAKFWPSVGRIDNVYGDRNLVCACLPIEAYREEGT